MIEVTGSEVAVHSLLNPSSVAVVGASSRPGTLSWWPLHLLQRYNFAGRIFPVNPGREELGGLRCYPSIEAIGEPVDVAVVAMNAESSAEAVAACASAGVRAVVLPAQGLGGQDEGGRAREAALLRVAGDAGMRIVGPNTDGVANLASGAVLSIQPLFGEGIPPGGVAVVTQSGASAGSLISRLKREGIGCRYYASAGNETDLGLADYMSVVVQEPEVRMVLSFVEAIRKPADFLAVGRLAAELGKPIVLIKVGRTAQAARRAAAHTGALAGEDRIYDAVFRSLGIIRVDELSDIVAVAKYFLAWGKPRSGGLGVMSVSGGQAGALADIAAAAHLTVPALGPEAQGRLADLLPFGSPHNPVDLTGDIATRDTLAADVYRSLADDESVDTVVYARKELTGDAGRRAAANLAKEVTSGMATPLVVYAMDGGVNDDERATYRDAGVPIYTSAAEMCRAVEALQAASVVQPAEPAVETSPGVQLPASASGVLDQAATTELLRAYGVGVVDEGLATTADEAVALAARMGYPVVLKVVSERILHKTEIGGVITDVRDEASLRAGFDVLVERGRAALDGDQLDGILVQQQITDGVEMIVGVVIDPQFGPFVLLGTGGVMAELLDDVVLRPAPVTATEATQMVAELRGRRLLEGHRGAPPADVAALADTVSAVSRLAADHRSALAELDLNPVAVRPDGRGAVALDALVVLAGASA